MVQIFWNSNAPLSPALDHELIELRLVDLGTRTKLRYLVREIRASWSSAAQQIQWNGHNDKAYATAQEAQSLFTSRKAILEREYPSATTLS